MLAEAVVLLGWIGYQQATKPAKPEPPPGWLLRKQKPQVIYVVEKPAPTATQASQKKEEPQPSDPEPAAVPAVPVDEQTQDFPVKHEPAATPPAAPTPKKPESDNEIAKRCLEFSASIDDSQPVERPFSIFADVNVKNNCDLNFPGEHVWATVAVRGQGDGFIGSDFGHFSGTIPPRGSASMMLEIQCDPAAARSLFATFRFFNP